MKKNWTEYLLWGVAALAVGGVGIYIYEEEKKKHAVSGPPMMGSSRACFWSNRPSYVHR